MCASESCSLIPIASNVSRPLPFSFSFSFVKYVCTTTVVSLLRVQPMTLKRQRSRAYSTGTNLYILLSFFFFFFIFFPLSSAFTPRSFVSVYQKDLCTKRVDQEDKTISRIGFFSFFSFFFFPLLFRHRDDLTTRIRKRSNGIVARRFARSRNDSSSWSLSGLRNYTYCYAILFGELFFRTSFQWIRPPTSRFPSTGNIEARSVNDTDRCNRSSTFPLFRTSSVRGAEILLFQRRISLPSCKMDIFEEFCTFEESLLSFAFKVQRCN